jgi:hypothetical protein
MSNQSFIPPQALERIEALQAEEEILEKSVAHQTGTSIPTLFADAATFIVNPSNVGTGILSRMVETDDTVSSAVQFKTLMVLAKIGEYHHEDAEIADFVNDFLSKLKRPTWQQTMESMLSATAYGFSVSETVFGLNKKLQKVPVRIPTYHPSTLAFETDPFGNVTEQGILQFIHQFNQYSNPNNMWQKISYGFQVKNPFTTPTDRLMPTRIPFVSNYGMARIPRNKVVHHVNLAGLSFGSPYGKTAVRTAHLPWQLKVFFMRQMGIAGKRASTPTLWGTAPMGTNNVLYKSPDAPKGDKGELLSPAQALKAMLSDRETDDAIVTGTDKDGYHLEALTNTANMDGFLNVINNLDVRMFRCFLLPSLVMTDGSAGSRALGDKHFQIVDHISSIEADNFGQTVINDLIERVIIENFGEQNDYGKFTKRPQSVEERERLANMFGTLTTSGIMKTHVPEDMDYMRSSLSLPKDADKSFDIDPDAISVNTQVGPDGKTIEQTPDQDGHSEKPEGSSHDASATEKPQDSALNGAQVSSLVDVVKSVAGGELPRESAIEIIMHAYNMTKEQAEKILGNAGAGFNSKADQVEESSDNDAGSVPGDKA